MLKRSRRGTSPAGGRDVQCRPHRPDTLGKLHAHRHGLFGYCRTCDPQFDIPLPALIAARGPDSPVVRKGSGGEAVGRLLDHLIGASKERRRNIEAEHLCSFEVEVDVIAFGLLDRKIARLAPMNNLIDIAGALSRDRSQIRAEAN
jgi:hypothetical protein